MTVKYYITRDSRDGALNKLCDVWHYKPVRHRIDKDIVWMPPDEHENALMVRETPDKLTKWYGTYPETDLEMIAVEQNVKP